MGDPGGWFFCGFIFGAGIVLWALWGTDRERGKEKEQIAATWQRTLDSWVLMNR